MSQWGDEQKRTAAAVFGGGEIADRLDFVDLFDEVNPKDVEARATGKCRLDLLEPAAEREIAKALAFGADKYGVRNYVTAPIHARVYVAAMKRHIDAWLEGEDYAEDSGAHHLGHIGANVHVALAAIAAGTFVDDRLATAAKDASISDPAKVGSHELPDAYRPSDARRGPVPEVLRQRAPERGGEHGG